MKKLSIGLLVMILMTISTLSGCQNSMSGTQDKVTKGSWVTPDNGFPHWQAE
jgi:predicted small secreted protein